MLSKEIRIKLERDANISPQGVYKIVHFLLLLLTKGLLSLFVSIPKFRGSVVVIEDARDFQNLIFPASIALHAKHKCNICFEEIIYITLHTETGVKTLTTFGPETKQNLLTR